MPSQSEEITRLTTFQAGLIQSRAHRALNVAMSQWLAQFEININEWALMGLLIAERTGRPNQLAQALGVSAPMGTKLINKLEERGLVTRRSTKEDGREVLVSLTQTGLEMTCDIEGVVRSQMRQYLAGVDDAHLKGYLNVLAFLAEKP